MRRREFITAIGGVAAWPLAGRAQQAVMPVIGWLYNAGAETQDPANLPALRKGLGEYGFVEGHNLAIEYRYANNDFNRLPELTADLVRRRVAVILATGGTVTTRAAKAATVAIPIVFVQGDDPVATGVVARLNRPGGNVTGITFLSAELGPKRLGLLKELVPKATRYGLLVNPNSPATNLLIADMRAAAASIGREIEVFAAGSIPEIDMAFADLVRKGAEALVVGNSSLFASRRVQLATLAAISRPGRLGRAR
jgi:putative ABC transport system substrate-binding protein